MRGRLVMALRSCLEPGCPQLVPRGRCATHARIVDRRRGSAAERGYGTRWAKLSRAFRQQYPLCGMRPDGQAPVMSLCHERGEITAATQTDHVVPHRGDSALLWDWLGLQSLCARCHARKTQAGL